LIDRSINQSINQRVRQGKTCYFASLKKWVESPKNETFYYEAPLNV